MWYFVRFIFFRQCLEFFLLFPLFFLFFLFSLSFSYSFFFFSFFLLFLCFPPFSLPSFFCSFRFSVFPSPFQLGLFCLGFFLQPFFLFSFFFFPFSFFSFLPLPGFCVYLDFRLFCPIFVIVFIIFISWGLLCLGCMCLRFFYYYFFIFVYIFVCFNCLDLWFSARLFLEEP